MVDVGETNKFDGMLSFLAPFVRDSIFLQLSGSLRSQSYIACHVKRDVLHVSSFW